MNIVQCYYCIFWHIFLEIGNYWSYNNQLDKFIVSPEPDVSVRLLDVKSIRFIVLGSDGIWDVLSPRHAIDFLNHLDEEVTITLQYE